MNEVAGREGSKEASWREMCVQWWARKVLSEGVVMAGGEGVDD